MTTATETIEIADDVIEQIEQAGAELSETLNDVVETPVPEVQPADPPKPRKKRIKKQKETPAPEPAVPEPEPERAPAEVVPEPALEETTKQEEVAAEADAGPVSPGFVASLDKEALVAAIKVAQGGVSRRSTLPIVECINVKRDGQKGLVLESTNLEIGFRIELPAVIREMTEEDLAQFTSEREEEPVVPPKEGEEPIQPKLLPREGGAIPAKMFIELVKEFPEERIALFFPADTRDLCYLKGKQTQIRIKCLDQAEFPLVPDLFEQGNPYCKIPRYQLGEMIEWANYAAADDNARPVLTGLFTRFSPYEENDLQVRLTFAACDAFRASVITQVISALGRVVEMRKYLDEQRLNLEVIIPAVTMNVLMKQMNNAVGSIFFVICPKPAQVGFKYQAKGQYPMMVTMVSRLIEGNYPNFESSTIMPTDPPQTTITVRRSQLSKFIKSCKPFARDSSNILDMVLKPANEEYPYPRLVLAAHHKDTGGSNLFMEGVKFTGREAKCTLNIKYVEDTLAHLPGDMIRIELDHLPDDSRFLNEEKTTRPIIFTPATHEGLRCIMMPMHKSR